MIVQSSHKDPIYLDGRIEDFFITYRSTIAEMSEEKLKTFVDAVIEKLLEKPKNLDQVSYKLYFYHVALSHRCFHFCYRKVTNSGQKFAKILTSLIALNC